MTKANVLEIAGRDEIYDLLTELLRSGAQQLSTFTAQIQIFSVIV